MKVNKKKNDKFWKLLQAGETEKARKLFFEE